MQSSDVLPKLYKLLDAMEHNTNDVVTQLQNNRLKVIRDDFGIPYDADDSESVGYKLVHYEMGTNFNALLEQIIQSSKETLTGNTYSVQPLEKRLDQNTFAESNLFGFLYQLTQDPELYARFRDPAQMDAVLSSYLPSDAYKEREAVKSLLAQPQNEQMFNDSVNAIVSTLESKYFVCC